MSKLHLNYSEYKQLVGDNAVGMYDRVTGQFFSNSGTGTFIAGPVKEIR